MGMKGLVGEVPQSERWRGVEDGRATDGTQLLSGATSVRVEVLDQTLSAVGVTAVGAAGSLEHGEADRAREILVLHLVYVLVCFRCGRIQEEVDGNPRANTDSRERERERERESTE